MRKEQWKDIGGYEGLYQVSNHGRVRSLDRRFVRANGRPHFVKGRTLSPSRPGGYCQVQLWEGGGYKARYVHCLVMEEFVGPTPPGKEINHKDGDLAHNALSNLEFMTHSENMLHAVHEIKTVTPPLNIHLQNKNKCTN